MEDKKLLLIALGCSFVGLGVLIFISDTVELSLSNVKDIENFSAEEYAQIEGEILSLNVNAGTYIFKIGDTKSDISVVVFTDEKLKIVKGDFIRVEGKIEEYKGRKEIIASKMAIL